MVGDEAYPPYQRPPLSKAYLLGTFERERLFLKPDAFYREAGCELILDTQRHRDRPRRQDRGARRTAARCPTTSCCSPPARGCASSTCPGADLPGMHYLRDIADVDGLQAVFSRASASPLSAAAISGWKWPRWAPSAGWT